MSDKLSKIEGSIIDFKNFLYDDLEEKKQK